jgi:hypothetical protein
MVAAGFGGLGELDARGAMERMKLVIYLIQQNLVSILFRGKKIEYTYCLPSIFFFFLNLFYLAPACPSPSPLMI